MDKLRRCDQRFGPLAIPLVANTYVFALCMELSAVAAPVCKKSLANEGGVRSHGGIDTALDCDCQAASHSGLG